MKTLAIGVMVLGLASPAMAGPLLTSAMARAETVSLEQDDTSERRYRKGSVRRWLEWTGIVGGVLVAATQQETCFGQFCKREWHAGIGSVGLSLLAVSAISKALPDPD